MTFESIIGIGFGIVGTAFSLIMLALFLVFWLLSVFFFRGIKPKYLFWLVLIGIIITPLVIVAWIIYLTPIVLRKIR